MLEKIKEKYKNELEQIIEGLSYGYYEELDQDNFECEVVDSFKANFKGNFSYGWDNGASKGVFIFKDFNFVIKIPFTHCDGDPLCGAIDSLYHWDYCGQEANRYKIAKNNNLEKVFLQTEFLTNINEHPIYIQCFAEPFSKINIEEHKSSTKADELEIENIAENDSYNYDLINTQWEADVYAVYGRDYYIKLKTFIKEKNIEDLRTDNIGYIGIYPVILDYAGFDY